MEKTYSWNRQVYTRKPGDQQIQPIPLHQRERVGPEMGYLSQDPTVTEQRPKSRVTYSFVTQYYFYHDNDYDVNGKNELDRVEFQRQGLISS